MKPVKTKKDFVRRYQENEFGNRSPTWEVEEWIKLPFEYSEGKLFHLRNKVAGGETYYNLTGQEVVDIWSQVNDPSNWFCSAMAPTEHTLLQGEVQRTGKGLGLRYTTVRKPMRDAFVEQDSYCMGLLAKLKLKTAMDPVSYEWLEYLLDTYDNHVVEFSAYGICFGTIPNRNTVFWEVRLYLWWALLASVSLIPCYGNQIA